MTDNLDELKRKWQEISARVDKLEETNQLITQRLANSNVATMQENLGNRIRHNGNIGFMLPLLAPSLVLVLDFPIWYAVIYAVVGIILGIKSRLLSKYILKGNLTSMPVAQAIEKAVKIKYKQQQGLIAGYVIFIILVIIGFFALPSKDMSVLIGACVGMVIGLAISIPRVATNMRMARMLIESLNDD